MDEKPEQPLPLDIKIIRQKQVVRISTSSSLDVTGENYSRSDFAFNAYTWIYYSPIDYLRDPSHRPMSMDAKPE